MLGAVLAVALVASAPNGVYEAAAVDLAQAKPADRPYLRYLSQWPVPDEGREALETDLKFWLHSLTFRRTAQPILRTPGGLYRIDLRDFGWDAKAWEELANADPYFAVTVAEGGKLLRGWLNPDVEQAVRDATHSTKAVLRADWFIARTSLEVGGKGFRQGFYSRFLGLPKTEKELFELVGAKEKRGENLLTRGGAVLESIVALHNRELQLIPTTTGGDLTFLWRSLDTDNDGAKSSVIENFRGTLQFAGGEYIGSLPNGLHYYWLANAKGEQLAEVPTTIAQDRETQPIHDVTVFSPWKCVSCHGKSDGIIPFSDVVSRLALDPEVGLATIGDKKGDAKQALEDYYLSDLGRTIRRHQEEYAERVEEITGEPVTTVRNQYIERVQGYLHGRVDLAVARRETGLDRDELRKSGNAQALLVCAGGRVSREAWEGAFAEVMTGVSHEWERGQKHAVPGSGIGGGGGGGRGEPGLRR